MIFANQGAGKTSYLAKIVKQESKRIRKGKSPYKYIVCTEQIKGAIYMQDSMLRNVLKTYAFEDTLLLIDEASLTYPNSVQDVTPAEKQWFKYCRHYNSMVIACSQAYDDVNVVLRRLQNELWHMLKMGCFTILRPISKNIGIDENTHQIIDKYFFKSIFNYKIFLRSPLYKLFDSYSRPERPIYNLRELADKQGVL
jgi:hypothetical protein